MFAYPFSQPPRLPSRDMVCEGDSVGASPQASSGPQLETEKGAEWLDAAKRKLKTVAPREQALPKVPQEPVWLALVKENLQETVKRALLS